MGGQIVGDDLLRVLLPGEESDVAEERLEDGGRYVAPVEHAVELCRVAHVALQRRQEDLRRVAEDDDAQRNGECEDVDAQRHLRPAPCGRLKKAVAHDHDVDDHVGHGAPEAERRDVMQVLEEGAGQEEDAADHHPGAGVDGAVGERADHQVAAEDDVEDARHEQLDQLRRVDDLGAYPPAETFFGDGDVRVTNTNQLTLLVGDVQAIDQDLARVAADVSDADHGRDGPVASV